jgi:orotate phosphoribosyltransferase-like protein
LPEAIEPLQKQIPGELLKPSSALKGEAFSCKEAVAELTVSLNTCEYL